MQNTVDGSVMEGPIEVGMTVCRMFGQHALDPKVFHYTVWYVSKKYFVDLNGDPTCMIYVKDTSGSLWWFFETEFRRRFVRDTIFAGNA